MQKAQVTNPLRVVETPVVARLKKTKAAAQTMQRIAAARGEKPPSKSIFSLPKE